MTVKMEGLTELSDIKSEFKSEFKAEFKAEEEKYFKLNEEFHNNVVSTTTQQEPANNCQWVRILSFSDRIAPF